jgi:hypothetical protein
MDSKKTPVPDTTVTRDLSQLSEKTGNIYTDCNDCSPRRKPDSC